MENLLGLDSQDFEFNGAPADHTLDFGTTLEPEVASTDDGNQPSSTTTPSTPFMDMISGAISTASSKLRADELRGGVTTYDPDLKRRYNEFPEIYNNRFDPADDNERIALQNWDTWDAVATGFAGFRDSFKDSFAQSLYVWPRTAKALLLLDTDYLKPSAEETQAMAAQMRENELENPVFFQPGTEDDILSKKFLASGIQNLGFTFGTLAELGSEWAATSLISGALTSIGQAPAAGTLMAGEATRTASKLPTFWKNITKMFVGSATDDAVKAAASVGTFELGPSRYLLQQPIRTGKVVAEDLRLLNATTNIGLNGAKAGVDIWDNALKLSARIPIVGHVADAARIAKAARNAELTGAELLKIGAGGLRRGFAEWQMAAGEAAIEMGGNYKQFMDENLYEAQRQGRKIDGQEYIDLQNFAMQSASADFSTNVGILAVSNRLMFGNILGKFGTDSKLLLQLKNAIGGNLAKELGIKTVVSKGVPKHYQLKGFQGLFGTWGVANQIRRDFDKKVMAWELGKSTLRGVTNFQVVEGLQENLQEGSNRYYIDYYSDLYKSGITNWGKSFEEAAKSQMSKQGFNTFLMGAMTGMFVNPVVNSIQYAKSAATYEGKKHAESIARTIDILNNFYTKTGSEKILKEHIKSIKLQTEYAENMRDAVANGNKYQYLNNKDSALIQTVMLAKRTGTMDYMYSFLKGYGENFSPQEFQEAFGYTPEELKKSSPKEVMDEIARSVKKYSDLYDKYQTKYGLMLGMEDYINDPAARMKFSIRKAALMDAIETVSFAEAKGQQSMIRSEEILKRVSALPSIGNSLSSSWNTLIDSREMSDRALILTNEIKALKESGPLDANAKQIIASKEREIEILDYLSKNMYETVTEKDPINPDKEVKYTRPRRSSIENERKQIANQIAEYLSLRNQESGISTVINKDEVYTALDDMYDYIVLGRDHHDYMQAVNLLSDPDNMTKFYENTMDARAGAHARLLYDEFQGLGEISQVGKDFIDTPEIKTLMDDLLKFSKTPYGSFKNYNKLQEILNQIIEKKNELLLGQFKEALELAQQQQQKLREQAEIDAKIRTSIQPIDVFGVDEDEALQYMEERYDIEEINNKFPFESEDINERLVTRYYKHPNGSRIAFEKKVRIPVEFDMEQNGEMVKLDNAEQIMEYLKIFEQSVYETHLQKRNQASEKETDEKTAEADEAKVKLESYVGETVVENGNPGTLKVNDKGGFYIEFPDGTTKDIVDSNEDSTFDDYSTLSRVLPLLPEEERALMSPTPNPVVEATQDGELLVDYVVNIEDGVRTLKSVVINGVSWEIEYNEQGEVSAFTRDYTPKQKGKKARNIVRRERLSVRNPKGAQYAAVVNSYIEMVINDIPEDVNDMADMSEALDQALNAVDTVIDSEATSRRVKEEIIDQFKLNKIINVNTPENITELRTKFGNPETRSQLTTDELVELALWASDLRKQIKKNWRVYIGNPIVNGFLTQLVKEYINPIDSLLSELDKKDGTRGPREEEITPRNTTKKERAKKSTEAGESRKRKRGAEPVQTEPKPEKARKGKKSVSDALDKIEEKADKKRRKSKERQVQPTDVASRVQKMSLGGATRIINKITNTKINKIKDSISASASSLEVGYTKDPFSSLNDNSTYCE